MDFDPWLAASQRLKVGILSLRLGRILGRPGDATRVVKYLMSSMSW